MGRRLAGVLAFFDGLLKKVMELVPPLQATILLQHTTDHILEA